MYTIYGKEHCIYCEKAKALLHNKATSYEYHDVVKDINQRNILLSKVKDVKTLPQIFLNEKYIGGFTELQAYLDL